jgi:nitroimidazol reductase NimA-like FMN-containing flavoprotein (pyridoxamine 5'-phosphate oxidase superfamily)
MSLAAGDLALLDDPLAVELLTSRFPARLAYVWSDGTPRVVPIWFHWTGSELVVCSPARAPKLKVLGQNSAVSVTIDSNEWPYRVLSLRGTATVTMLDDVAPEYAAAAERYLGPVQGQAWVEQVRGMPVGRVAITPRWANLLDFEQRLPSALSV